MQRRPPISTRTDTLFPYPTLFRSIVDALPLSRTGALASIVRKAVGYRAGDKKDPATRTFQVIRIHLNRELEELERGLEAAEAVLEPGGRLAIVTFHSLADRIVTQFLRRRSGSEGAGKVGTGGVGGRRGY